MDALSPEVIKGNTSFGSGAYDWDASASSGVFKTPTGANTLSGNVTVAAAKTLTVTSGATTLTGASGGTTLSLTAGSSTGIGLVINGVASQSGDHFRSMDSGGFIMARMGFDGRCSFGFTGVSTAVSGQFLMSVAPSFADAGFSYLGAGSFAPTYKPVNETTKTVVGILTGFTLNLTNATANQAGLGFAFGQNQSGIGLYVSDTVPTGGTARTIPELYDILVQSVFRLHTVTTWRRLAFDALSISTGTITNLYGIYLKDPTGAGTVTNNYGIYIESVAKGATLNYAIYTAGGTLMFNGDVKLGTIGNGLYVKEGTNATMGTATLVLGTATVSTTKVTANSRIFLAVESLGTVTIPKTVAVTARTAGTSFVITSSDLTDTSTVAWIIMEPA